MVPGVISELAKSSYIRFTKTSHFIWLNFGYGKIDLYYVHRRERWHLFLVRFPKCLLRRSHLRIMDPVVLQRVFHRPSTPCYGYLRPVHFRSPSWSLPTALSARPERHLFQDALILFVGHQRILPLPRAILGLRINLVLGSSAKRRESCGALGLGNWIIYRSVSYRFR